MSVWTKEPIIDQINAVQRDSLAGSLGIEFTEVGPDFMVARMPVDQRTRQPYGLLHGGASATLAETLGSVAGLFAVNSDTHYVVGLEINVNHMRPVEAGLVMGTARPLHLGRTTQVWQIHIENGQGQLVSASRLTLAVRARENNDQ